MKDVKILSPRDIRVLNVILHLNNQNLRVTERSIHDHVRKWMTVGTVHNAVVSLRNAGLISYNEHQHGTIQPRVRFIPADHL